MVKVVIYSSAYCPYCHRAKALLSHKQVVFDEISLDEEPGRRAEMIELSGGRRTVPQIFIDNKHVGGCDDLMALEYQGDLDTLLNK
ncbi:glutaredoxin 3 [Thalassotalea mangrovi]|uniref:Glutaredoxin n=1 Tax=Thalassotalea mangrovi TaxID=2572245 RepID=A0A4U1B816_9GAMM|nr:glutaredoxin 3 [Thalassotalea mangrovi]TKB46649.1 glutaredoxin 3 [Thalassotalea mangrovi]